MNAMNLRVFKAGLFGVFFSGWVGVLPAQAAATQGDTAADRPAEPRKERSLSLDKLKISGYVQAQFQYGAKDADLSVGAGNEHTDRPFSRFGIRRGRLKFAYEGSLASAVFQIDLTEKGLGLKDAYLNLRDPWLRTNELRAGVFNRPFGQEIAYSSSRRESPERSVIFRRLFPDERDLGLKAVLRPPVGSPLQGAALKLAMLAGNGIARDVDSRKDFAGQLTYDNGIGEAFTYGAGVSYYRGGVYQGSDKLYRMEGRAFVADESGPVKGRYAKREYFGFDARMSLTSVLGLTSLRAEYLFGTQPGTADSSGSPDYSALPTADTYIRNFSGGYAMLVQDIGRLPFALVVKYDWYDPNVKVAGSDVGLNGTGKTDALQQTWGVGALWYAAKDIRLQAYYEFVGWEKTDNLPELNGLNADVFTLRLQYKF